MTVNPKILGGKPIIKGTRITVEFILDLYNCAILNRHYGLQNCATKGMINSGLFCMVSKV
ncbi:MAG: DUF433 domain-containing protein [Candidatus Kuenenia stuttgartiensis]|uniref:DUF433 domain-containing protein n=1 Tax=Candidatus Kuenenia TaxID=380738 RepID=UPI000C084F71|nr:DUF433 domain-containing protein [Planctomycetia bacterium]MBE7546888.1 DUF433 domain-containing protein [Planctomycetia bacterium]MBZ0192092.1 DUF433 domain-containing protein [Candidatus Kuenenia stuttgartiensis]MCL4728596.1 DUF433 domain-containing protein [Candidatus Kuenenia stuttgartiensis]